MKEPWLLPKNRGLPRVRVLSQTPNFRDDTAYAPSQKTIAVISEAFKTKKFDGKPNLLWPRRGDQLARSIEMANKAVYDMSVAERALEGMGTTTTALLFSPNRRRTYVAHVGDSRCYRIREGAMKAITSDHTIGNLLGSTGKLASQLTRAVGIAPTVEVDLYVDAPLPDDIYVLCSDGLTKMVPEAEICKIATQSSDIQGNAQRLINEANRLGGKDNITVILVRVDEPFSERRRRRSMAPSA